MTRHYARTGMKITLFVILVWLVNPIAGDMACGANPDGPQNHEWSVWNKQTDVFTFQDYPSLQNQPFDNRMFIYDIENQSRPDLYHVLKLALNEFQIFAGIRYLMDRTEKKLEKWAVKLKIKGEITFDEQGRSDGVLLNKLGPASKNRGHPSAWASLLVPREIKWNIGFDPGANSAFGELNLGPHWMLTGIVGEEQEVRMLFKYEF